jgi:hypothetical protein
MKPTLFQIRAVLFYPITLCAITAIAYIAMYAWTGRGNGALMIFLCSLPMAFWHVAQVQRQTLEYAESLERRLQAIERPAAAA